MTSAPVENSAVEIEAGSIRAIRPLREGDPEPGAHCILPGLINTHAHLAYTALRNSLDHLPFFGWVRRLTEIKYTLLNEEDIIRSTALGISECLRSGITTIADLSDCEPGLKVLSESPLRGKFYWEIFGVEKEKAEETWSGLNNRYRRLKEKYATDRLQIGISPHACYTVRPELYTHVAKWAVSNQVPISFHASESRAEEEFIRSRTGVIADFLRTRASDWKIQGSTSIEHLQRSDIFETKPLLAHLVQASEKDLDFIRAADIPVSHCPKSNAKFGHGIAPVSRMIAKDICVGLGTDSAASNNRLDLFEEGRFALLQQRQRYGTDSGLSEQKILAMMTIDGAKALGMEERIGSIEAGKAADLILVKMPGYYADSGQVLNHLIHNTSASDVLKTIIDGRVAEFEAPDVSEIYSKVSRL